MLPLPLATLLPSLSRRIKTDLLLEAGVCSLSGPALVARKLVVWGVDAADWGHSAEIVVAGAGQVKVIARVCGAASITGGEVKSVSYLLGMGIGNGQKKS